MWETKHGLHGHTLYSKWIYRHDDYAINRIKNLLKEGDYACE